MTIPNIYHLKYFVDAVELGGISAAAEKNRVSHPAISQAIKALEEQMDMQLLIHGKRKFEVTQRGYALATESKEILELLKRMADKSNAALTKIVGTATLGISQSMTQDLLIHIIKKMTKLHPDVRLEVVFGTTSDLLEKTAKGSLDLSITLEKQSLPTLIQVPIKSGRFVLITPPEKKDLTQIEFLLTEPRYETEFFKKAYKDHYAQHPSISHEIGSWSAIIELVANGLGAGLVPDFALSIEQRRKVSILNTPWYDCPYKIYLNLKKSSDKKTPLKASLSEIIRSLGKS
ncbi:MAG TPA: LysR family transcriptional regulator [Bdellovibrio sp.]|uniref:LysR family transcriptional regulator n=1 Tax=Bdellovibrio sp. TaxID=28201 RepID=UPI002EE1349B